MALTEDEKKLVNNPHITIQELQLGIWTLKLDATSFHLRKHWADVKSAVPLVWRLTIDILGIAPFHFTAYILCQILKGIEDSLLLQLSNKLLRIVEAGVAEGKPDGYAIILAILTRLLSTLVFAWFDWYGDKILDILRSRVTHHFELLLMKAKLRVDLPTSQETGSKQEGSARQAWEALELIVTFLTNVLRAVSQLAFIAHLSRSMTGGPLFVLICLSHPLFSTYFTRALWDKVCFGYVSNPHYRRMKALEKLANGSFRQDIISGGLAEWITDQYEQSHQSIGELSISPPYHQYGHRDSPLNSMFLQFLEFMPTIFCALNAIVHPDKFSVASIAILQQSSTTLRYSLRSALHTTQLFRSSVAAVKTVYASAEVINSMNVGEVPYPRNDKEKALQGMSFHLNNISFSYPGSQKTTTALKDISLDIKAGQLVVIVGANGSGKSTLIRILSRLYDPTSGEVLIDGLASAEYRVEDLHEATTLLSQDSNIYPLSLGENIGLGYPAKVWDDELVTTAAKEGGALEFIAKLKDGMKTVLDPIIDTFQIHLYNNKTHPLYNDMEKIRKTIDISGGERQRVVAARSFMRFRSGKVKFVAVDEPSSALDAEGELKLFENLIKVREGKTMVFVTHRFGHLTRYADQIICMKDGTIMETGSHDELMEKRGEYAKLYEIQASAFAPPS
ncbi:P-loop containing nucleoside triphosphate hydrolase protein [Flammula alnicola]|nr:P-loop containing nucleoside triphosphate hydrolase protein [Flammula alnicola]